MIQRLIDDAIAAKRNVGRIGSGKFSVSDAGRCHLMRFWKRQGKVQTKQPDERTYRVFEVGNIFERFILDLIPPAKVGIRQGLVEDEHRKGYYDMLLANKILLDCKTIHSRKFWRNEKEGWDKDVHYRHQILTYYDMLPEGLKPSECRLVYISKDDLCIAEIGVPVTPDSLRDVRGDWNQLLTNWGCNLEPNPNPLPWECAYCGYLDVCEYGIKRQEEKENAKKAKKSSQRLPDSTGTADTDTL